MSRAYPTQPLSDYVGVYWRRRVAAAPYPDRTPERERCASCRRRDWIRICPASHHEGRGA